MIYLPICLAEGGVNGTGLVTSLGIFETFEVGLGVVMLVSQWDFSGFEVGIFDLVCDGLTTWDGVLLPEESEAEKIIFFQ